MCVALGAALAAPFACSAAPGTAPLPERPAASTPGEIRGVMLDQTLAGYPVAGQPVRLEIVERGSRSTRDTTTDSEGRFAFLGLPVGGLRVFLVQVQYGGVPYTDRVQLTPAVPVQDVRISAFESSRDRSVVRGAVALAIVEATHGTLRVSIVQRLENSTDRAVVVTDANPLVFPLPLVSPPPRAAAPVELIGGWWNPRVTHDAITDAIPVLPGAMEVAYAFGVAPSAKSATLRWAFPYGATDVDLLVADQGIRVSGNGVHADGIVTERGQRYARWSGGPVGPGESVSLRLDGLSVSNDRWPEIAAGLLGLTLALGLAAALRRRPARA